MAEHGKELLSAAHGFGVKLAAGGSASGALIEHADHGDGWHAGDFAVVAVDSVKAGLHGMFLVRIRDHDGGHVADFVASDGKVAATAPTLAYRIRPVASAPGATPEVSVTIGGCTFFAATDSDGYTHIGAICHGQLREIILG
jgi:hypothetical protein